MLTAAVTCTVGATCAAIWARVRRSEKFAPIEGEPALLQTQAQPGLGGVGGRRRHRRPRPLNGVPGHLCGKEKHGSPNG